MSAVPAWLGAGRKVRLRPAGRGDIVDLALAGRTAEVDRVEHGDDGRVQVVVMLEGDPARDLAAMSQIGHRFFFRTDELEPVDTVAAGTSSALVASIGDCYADDGAFGPEVVNRLRRHSLSGAQFAEFGIRAEDLGHALGAGYTHAVLLGTSRRGNRQGTLTVSQPEQLSPPSPACTSDPAAVLERARWHGAGKAQASRVLVVEWEPVGTGAELGEPAMAAIDEAVELVESLLGADFDQQGSTADTRFDAARSR